MQCSSTPGTADSATLRARSRWASRNSHSPRRMLLLVDRLRSGSCLYGDFRDAHGAIWASKCSQEQPQAVLQPPCSAIAGHVWAGTCQQALKGGCSHRRSPVHRDHDGLRQLFVAARAPRVSRVIRDALSQVELASQKQSFTSRFSRRRGCSRCKRYSSDWRPATQWFQTQHQAAANQWLNEDDQRHPQLGSQDLQSPACWCSANA